MRVWRRKALSVGLGIAAGLVAAELGLRLYFYENEAIGEYFGRGAFVWDARLGYRHARAARAFLSREGAFGPFTVATNELGFRDARVARPRASGPPRIAVAGASFVFGVGIEHDEDLFHHQLERTLRRQPGWPGDLEVYNLSQAGYLTDDVCAVVEENLDRVCPDLVLLEVREFGRFSKVPRPLEIETLDGYFFNTNRFLRGTLFDYLRTHSYVVMRLSHSRVREAFDRLSFLGFRRRPGRPAFAATHMSPTLVQLRERLDERGIPLICFVIHPPGEDRSDLGALLRGGGFEVLDIRCQPGWHLERDPHWNALGHRAAAEAVAGALAPGRLLERRAR
jgi:hypothetical protein